MQDVMPMAPSAGRIDGLLQRLMDYLPRGNTLDEKAWHRRHRTLQWVLFLHVPGLVGLGRTLGHSWLTIIEVVAPAVACLLIGHFMTHRRWASFFVTGGLVFCSVALVLITRGSIEAHFHFFIIIGFIALYQDWVPFLWNVAFTVLSHGIGTIWLGGQIFNHPAAQQHPWVWSFIHGVAVLFACIGMVIFWRITEDEQTQKEALGRQLITADAEIGRRQFISDMLVNLARRNQSMLYRQLDLINHLEDKERDPDALSDLFKIDHLATRIRRNAESLLVLAGEQQPRTWSAPVLLRDVVRASIAETEDLDRVVFAVDDRVAVSGATVADVTHLLAELTENAVRFSPPETAVTIRVRPNRRDEGGQLLTVEDWGVGMPPDELAAANELMAHPREVDLAVSQRLGFHVVSRLAARHGISVSLSATPGSGITALVVLPAALFTAEAPVDVETPAPALAQPGVDHGYVRGGDDPSTVPTPARGRRAVPATGATPGPGIPVVRNGDAWLPPEPFAALPGPDSGPVGPEGRWRGWWSPDMHGPDGPTGFHGDGAFSTSGHAAGHGANGSNGSNGHGTNGHGTNGHDGNGYGLNGYGANGNGANGHGANGHGANGHGANGTNGHGTNGHGTNGHGTNGQGANGHGTHDHALNGRGADPFGAVDQDADGYDADDDATGYIADGHAVGDVLWSRGDDELPAVPAADRAADGAGTDDRDAPVGGSASAGPVRDGGLPARRPRPTPIPAARPEPSLSGDPRSSDARVDTGPRPYAVMPGAAPVGGPSVPVQPRPGAPRPGPEPALPRPRGDELAAAEPVRTPHATPGLPGSRGLRRRVPQSHLAPELRDRSHGLADTAAPLSADAAASALSRYQASRQAAQAIVDVPGAPRPIDEGERA